MLKKLLLPALLLLGTAAFGQSRIGAEVGMNLYQQKFVVNQTVQRGDFLPGLRVGVTGDLGLSPNIFLQTGAYYTMGNTRYTGSFGVGTAEIRRTVHSLQVPLHVVFKTPAGAGQFFLGAGPSLSFNLGGTDKGKGNVLGFSFNNERSIKIGSDGDLRALNLWGGVRLGYEFSSGIYLKGAYDYGLLNLNPQGDENNRAKEMSFAFSVGYFL